ncbi:MAG TPA: Crp/Fnr family transcriptional regulator, partial [Chthonomonadales bacterium]|nr:Crp/Fnr family transcriptional regulator [Chthonomonadales bacterium]
QRMPIDPAQLSMAPLFDGLSPEQMHKIGERARQRTYRADEAIVHQLDPGETFYVILRGTVKVSTTLADGNEVFLALLAAGDTFGEMSLVDSGSRSADVVTQEETTLVSIDRSLFEELVATVPPFTRNLLRILARRLRLANVRIQAHCTLDVYGLVARQILEFTELYGELQQDGSTRIPIRLTQGSMAELVGASRERVNQAMVAYRTRGAISIDSSYHITVHKPDDLRKRIQLF